MTAHPHVVPRRHLLIAALAAPLLARARQPSPRFAVERNGDAIDVRASALLRADLGTAWRTLVDYARLPDFIPGMLASELLERHGDDLLLRQSGRAGVGPFERSFSLTMVVREYPMREVAARAIDGDFERFESSYLLSGAGDGHTRLDCIASMQPKGAVPALVGVPLMRHLMHGQFAALLAEVERRAAA